MAKRGDLRIWWIPQVPMKAFLKDVPDLRTAHILLDTLADYDLFQYHNRIKPDYSNAGGLTIYDPDCIENDDPETGWVDWSDEDTGEDITEYRRRVFEEPTP